jgi:hypothetical protein
MQVHLHASPIAGNQTNLNYLLFAWWVHGAWTLQEDA